MAKAKTKAKAKAKKKSNVSAAALRQAIGVINRVTCERRIRGKYAKVSACRPKKKKK